MKMVQNSIHALPPLPPWHHYYAILLGSPTKNNAKNISSWKNMAEQQTVLLVAVVPMDAKKRKE